MTPRAEGATRRVCVAAFLLIAGLAAGPIGTHVYWMLGGTWGLGPEETYSATGVRVVAAVVVLLLVAAVLVVLARVGFWQQAIVSDRVIRFFAWALAAVFLGEAVAAGARRRRHSAYAAWLDERDAWQPLTRADLRTGNDEIAASTVAAGGGVQAVIEATGLRTRENVLRLIDPVILVTAFANEAAARAVPEPPRERLRRLVPDAELVRRRAAGETLRRIAADYEVAHTTLYRGTGNLLWLALSPSVGTATETSARRAPQLTTPPLRRPPRRGGVAEHKERLMAGLRTKSDKVR